MEPLSPIKARLLATLKMGIISGGDRHERLIAESQVKEAIERIAALEAELAAAPQKERERLAKLAESVPTRRSFDVMNGQILTATEILAGKRLD